MIAILRTVRKLGVDARGATAIEYGLIVALIACACIGAFHNLAGGSNSWWGRLDTKIATASSGGS